MDDFIENVFRLARFFISSLAGLITTIVNPYMVFFKKKVLAFTLF
nr:hypothetical protein MW556_pgp088 [Erythrolobus coxiae]UNJ17719.1 hypothetical protein [Erythrolobus coxiae]